MGCLRRFRAMFWSASSLITDSSHRPTLKDSYLRTSLSPRRLFWQNARIRKNGIRRNGAKRMRGRLKWYCRMGPAVTVWRIPMRLNLILAANGQRQSAKARIIHYRPKRNRELFWYWRRSKTENIGFGIIPPSNTSIYRLIPGKSEMDHISDIIGRL